MSRAPGQLDFPHALRILKRMKLKRRGRSDKGISLIIPKREGSFNHGNQNPGGG